MSVEDTTPNADTVDQTPGAPDTATTPASTEDRPEDVSVAAAMQDARNAVPAEPTTDTAPDASTPAEGPSADSTTIPAATAPQGGFLSALSGLGIEHTYQTEEEAAKAFKELRGKLSERDQLAQIGAAVLPYQAEFEQWRRSKETPQGNGNADQGQQGWAPPTQFNPAWLTELQKPQEQQNPAVINEINQFANYSTQKWSEWMFNPQQMVDELVKPMVNEMLETERTSRQEYDATRQTVEANRDLCVKYETQISQMLQRGTPLDVAIDYYKMVDGTAGAPTPTTIPAKPAGAAAPATPPGVIPQTPPGKPDADDADPDSTYYADPRKAGLEALKAVGHNPTPGSIG